MKKHSIINLLLISALITLSPVPIFAQKKHLKSPGDTTITLLIRLKNPAAVIHILKAPLKYNKNFAYSLTFDDGLISAFLTAFPLMHGGTVCGKYIDEWQNDQGGDGKISKGLFYSDGCGNRIPFSAAIAINAKHIEGDSIAKRGHLSWTEINYLAQAGWSVMNHGYAHATAKNTDYADEVKRNDDSIALVTHICPSQFIVPGGQGPPGYDLAYTKAAFTQGLNAVGGNEGLGPIIWVDRPINLINMTYKRAYATSNAGIVTLFKDKHNIMDSLNKINLTTGRGQYYWFNEFTHSSGNDNLWGISLKYETLKYYLENIARLYGTEGKDNLWVAPFEEVYDYLRIREAMEIETERKKGLLMVRISIPHELMKLRYKAVTILLAGAKHFFVANSSKFKRLSSNPQKAGLITVEF